MPTSANALPGLGPVTIAEARAAPVPEGQRSAPVLAHGSMLVKFYQPQGPDLQTPHDQDELYLIASGSGWFRNGETRHRFAPGDVIFVAANVVHRFEDFSCDCSTWVVFYGPKGGEA
jgi:mannose-6-phosphate isomerase-like protein (cupin superfamily)